MRDNDKRRTPWGAGQLRALGLVDGHTEYCPGSEQAQRESRTAARLAVRELVATLDRRGVRHDRA